MTKTYSSVDTIPNAQPCLKLDLLSLFSGNQRILIVALFRTEAARPNVRRVSAVVRGVEAGLARRLMLHLGETDGQALSDSLNIFAANRPAVDAYAAACLVRAGKQVAK